MKSLAAVLQSVAVTLWVGGMWAIGFIAAPTLFARLADRTAAGVIAGRLFTLIALIGTVCAAYLLIYRLARHGASAFKQLLFWIVLLMLVLVVAGEFGIQPILAALKTQALPKQVMESVFRDRFAVWHGVASVVYIIQSVLGVVLITLHAKQNNK